MHPVLAVDPIVWIGAGAILFMAFLIFIVIASRYTKVGPNQVLVISGIKRKIETIATEIYGADGVDYTSHAEKAIARWEGIGLGQTPVCIAKTQYSFSDDPTLMGRPKGFRITIRDVTPSAGAGFVVALAGDIMTMPGLPKVPAAVGMRVLPDGTIEGLS